MLAIQQLGRLWQIIRVVRKHALGDLIEGHSLPLIRGSDAARARARGVRLREALEELGPVFVKLGQALSTRRDLLPPDIADELAKLQDQVPPFPGDVAVAEIERAYGQKIHEVFAEFDAQPLASASIAQAHAARLPPQAGNGAGTAVVVKVLRPGMREIIRRDLDLMYLIAHLAERFWADGRRLRPSAVVAEYEKIIFDELDLLREAANASQLRANWLGSEIIYHPVVFFELTRPNVLVLEHLHGIPIDDIAALKAAGVNFQVLAERGVEIFFKQVFRDNFFHADMHPGNIFVDASDPQQPRYIGLDFGIVGSLTPSDQRYLADNLLAFFNRDYGKVAELHIESGWVPEGTRVDEFESAIRTVCEPIFNRPLSEISFGFFIMRLFQTARRFRMEIQPQLVLLQKTILNVEGLGRQLYPQLDLWKTAKPIMETWVRERLSPRHTFEQIREQLPALAESLPLIAHAAWRRLQSGDWPNQDKRTAEALHEIRKDLEAGQRRNRSLILGLGLLVMALLLPQALEVAVGWALIPAAFGVWLCWRAR